ncbi:MAG: YiiD C-terminal domain-containing protein [Gemmatimonadota bacterium]|nr:YiiD C-terminal domain-containing protein [Gemmatimonadota bacterium]MDZ4864254.1 YiiD C-terminal domain-containing protein [Gemmatimonadota bacterium]
MTDSLQRLLNTELPITRHLGLRVVVADPERVILRAPLAPNRNHRGTAFAGSLNAIATLAGWSWLTLFLRHHQLAGQVVLQDSSITYARPVATDFTATCPAPEAATIARFVATFARSGRGRLRLTVEIADEAGAAGSFTGRYVAERLKARTGATPA